MKYFKLKITSALLAMMVMVTMVSCDTLTGEPDLPIPLDQTLSNTGGFLRVTSVTVAGFDFSNLAEAEYIFTGEFFDEQNGDLLENVVFEVSYNSAGYSDPEGDPEIPLTEFRTVAASEFTDGENGLPQRTFTITLDEVATALGLDPRSEADGGDIALGDEFRVVWTVNMTNGKSFSVRDASPAVNGGFYSSPYQASIPVAFVIPSNLFTGSYTITQDDPNAGPILNPLMTDTEFTVDLIIDPTNTLNGRTFEFTIYGGGFGTADLNLALVRGTTQADNYATLNGPLGLGLSCGGPEIVWSPITDPAQSDFDTADDSQFTFAFEANSNLSCGAGAVPVTFTATRN